MKSFETGLRDDIFWWQSCVPFCGLSDEELMKNVKRPERKLARERCSTKVNRELKMW